MIPEIQPSESAILRSSAVNGGSHHVFEPARSPFGRCRHLDLEKDGKLATADNPLILANAVTDLLDNSEYSKDDLAALFRRRWQAELNLRSLKTVMQMEHLRCKKPHRVRNE